MPFYFANEQRGVCISATTCWCITARPPGTRAGLLIGYQEAAAVNSRR